MQFAVVAVLCVALAAHAVAQSTKSMGWVAGPRGEGNCNTVCSNAGGVCHEASLRAVSAVNFANVNDRLDSFGCLKFPVIIKEFNPSYNFNNKNCNSDSSIATCAGPIDGVNAALVRFCCCNSDAGCPSTVITPVDCEVSPWTNSGSCTASCGGGSQTRTRSVLVQASDGGADCPAEMEDTVSCNDFNCPVDCVLSSWSGFDSCSVSCGGGVHTRFRSVAVTESDGGAACTGAQSETATCNAQNCPVDCVFSLWAPYPACPVSCGGASQTKSRTIVSPGMYGGKTCDGPNTLSRVCNDSPCPIDCTLSSWTSNTPCDVTCGDGTQLRSRSVLAAAQFGGKCPKTMTRTRVCHKFTCPGSLAVGDFCFFDGSCASGNCNLDSGDNLGDCIACSEETGRADGCRCFLGLAGHCAGECRAGMNRNACACGSSTNRAPGCSCSSNDECGSNDCMYDNTCAEFGGNAR